MKTLKLIMGIGPKISQEHPTDDLSDDLSDSNVNEKPIVRLRNIVRNVRIYTLGTALEEIKRPVITSSDCFWLLVNLHINIRFIIQYIDLSLEWGGFLVWIVFTFTNISVCSGFGFIFTFLGSYGDRSYLTVWDMMPIFCGLAVCVTLVETLKMIETSLIIASGFMSFNDFFRPDNIENNADTPIPCNKTRYNFIPAVAVPYGISKRFTSYGYKPEGIKLAEWTVDTWRVHMMLLVYLCVAVIRLSKFKRYRFYPLRINFILLAGFITLTIIMSSMIKPNPIGKIIHYNVEQYTNVEAYIQIIMFSLIEYLPMHWVTLGYLSQHEALMSKIWITAALKIVVSFALLYWIPFVAGDLANYTKVERSECLQFFGIHFIFVMIPITISISVFQGLAAPFYIFYFILIVMHGLTNILITVDLFQYSFVTSQRLLYRYRNIIYVLIICILIFITYPFSIETTHYFLFYLNVKSHCFTIIIILSLSTLAMAVYGLERINGDHLFMKGVLYPHNNFLKIWFLINFMLVCLFLSRIYFYDYRTDADHYIYWILVGVCIAPTAYGVWMSCAFRNKYHGLLQPRNSWGMPSANLRTQRRMKTLHTMYTYRMKRDCPHNCLLDQPVLMRMVETSLDQQEAELGVRRINKLKLAIDRISRESGLL